VNAEDLRSQFPVLRKVAYMNTGTNGPVPARAEEAALAELRRQLENGRAGKAHWERMQVLNQGLRERVAALAGCDEDELAVTHSTTDGLNTVLSALPLRRGDEVLTSDQEHPGMLGPLARAVARIGIEVRKAPFAELAGAVSSSTRLVACSHVSWVGGEVVDHDALRATGVPLLLDGAQGLGAIPLDLHALGCDFYAASGQKWLCGPDGSGYLYVRRDRLEDLSPPWPSYGSYSDAVALDFHEGAQRLDLTPASAESRAFALASFDVLAEAGWAEVLERGPRLADRLAGLLAEGGAEVAPRGRTTLVSWRREDAEQEVERLAADGILVRFLPGRGLVRASVGAWSNEEEVERVARATCAS
jgi:L-cysteine/cystine lyase